MPFFALVGFARKIIWNLPSKIVLVFKRRNTKIPLKKILGIVGLTVLGPTGVTYGLDYWWKGGPTDGPVRASAG
jgi:hypothetical protein